MADKSGSAGYLQLNLRGEPFGGGNVFRIEHIAFENPALSFAKSIGMEQPFFDTRIFISNELVPAETSERKFLSGVKSSLCIKY
jgi:hypothetical protein